jgi:hypothetical protein
VSSSLKPRSSNSERKNIRHRGGKGGAILRFASFLWRK